MLSSYGDILFSRIDYTSTEIYGQCLTFFYFSGYLYFYQLLLTLC